MEPAHEPADCVEDATAAGFIEGLLPEGEIARVEAHIDRCAACRAHLVRLVRARTNAPSPPDRADGRLLAAGTVLDRYQIQRVVGLGSMGVVYAAYDTQLKREIALKLVRAQTDQQRLLREAHALARLRHPNVVTVYDLGAAGDRVFIAMELVRGVTLTERLRRARSVDDIIALFVQAARGLEAAHAAGLVHRDFKPDNVLVGDDGRVCVTDFGLARDSDAAADPPEPPSTSDAMPPTVTRTGVIAGTPAYMSPEQHRGQRADPASDQFSFCVALYEALYGERPFEGNDLHELARNVIAGNVRRPRGRRKLPRALAQIVMRGLAREPTQRHPSMASLADALAAVRRARAPAIAAAALGVALVLVLVLVRALGVGTRPTETCADSASLVDHVWGPFERARSIARLAGQRPRELAMITAAARRVDDWAAAWRLARRAACAADPAQRAARLGCLDQALAELRAQVAVWAGAGPDVADRALATATALPTPDACAARTSQPIDPAIGERLARVRALHRAGLDATAKADVPALLAAAERSGNPAAIAAASLASGTIAHATGELETARAGLARAAHEAAVAADDPLLFDALVAQASVVIDQGRPLDSLGLLAAAEALAVRAGLERTEALARTRGAALTEAGRLREGIAELERGLAAASLRAQRDPSAREAVAKLLASVAAAHTQLQDYARARELLRRVLEIEQDVYGAEHPEVAKTLHDLAIDEARLGAHADALEHLGRARELLVAAYGERSLHVGTTDLALGNALAQQGKSGDARRVLERALATLSAVLPPDHLLLAAAERDLAVLDDADDNCRASIPRHQRALAILERAGRGGPDLANEQLNLGACLTDVGRFAEARAMIERAVAALDAAGMSELDCSRAWAVWSDLEWHEGNRGKAISLAHKILAATRGSDRPDIVQLRDYVQGTLETWTRTR